MLSQDPYRPFDLGRVKVVRLLDETVTDQELSWLKKPQEAYLESLELKEVLATTLSLLPKLLEVLAITDLAHLSESAKESHSLLLIRAVQAHIELPRRIASRRILCPAER